MNIKQKLGSRKFWTMLLGWLTSMATAFGASENTIVQITAVIGGFGVMAVYLLAEAKVDAARSRNSKAGDDLDD